jgi:hypothetical protein
MANPTTYFGWVMPNSADLVTDLPADFNVFGQGVDTSMQYLLGGTTGQVLSKTSATNMAFTWVTPTDQTPLTTKGDLFSFTTVDARLAVGANETRLVADSVQATGLKYVADTTNYAINAKADLLVGTAADTVAALTVGTNGQVLTADSTVSPTGLKWATSSSGGMTLLSTTTLTGATTDISSISQDYINLVFVCYGVTNATGNGSLLISPNTSLATNQNFMEGTTNGTIAGGAIYAGYNNTWLRTDSANTTIITIYNYAATTFQKPFNIISNFLNASSARIAFQGAGIISSNNAISSIRFDQSGGDFSTGTVLTYGVK